MGAIAGAEGWSLLAVESRHLEDVIREAGSRAGGHRNDPVYLAKLAEAAEFLQKVVKGVTPVHYLTEALATDDFPLLMGDILDRQLLGHYNETRPTWRNYAKKGTVRDFRQVRRISVDGLEGRLYPDWHVAELEQGKENNNLTETGYLYGVEVYERKVGLNWRMLINDDLDAFRDLPGRLARGARRTEEHFATTLFVSSSGPNATFYASGNSNIINATNAGGDFTVDNPRLSIMGLQQGFVVLANQVDADGEPILIESVELVVPPALEITAMNILNATELRIKTSSAASPEDNVGGGTDGQELITSNWIKSRLRLSVNPYLPIVDTTSGHAAWYLFANPDNGRPAMEVGFLRGYEEPGLYQKMPDMMRVGGGPVPALGSFDTGEIQYKVMHVIGGTLLDPKMSVSSTGAHS